jgi:hypothetical protein
MQSDLYDQDLYAWAMTNARLVRDRRLDALDWEHIAEELESMGKSELRALESRFAVLLAHLLKWQFQSEKRSKSWERTLVEQRKRIARLLRDSPSLRPKLGDILPDAYDSALRLAAEETGLDESEFPQSCPYEVEQALNLAFFPDLKDPANG